MPPITIRCPRCHRSVELRHGRVGQVTCPHCGHRWVPRRDRGVGGSAPTDRVKGLSGTMRTPLVPPPALRPLPPVQTTPAMEPPGPAAQPTPEVQQSQVRSRARLRVSDVVSRTLDPHAPPPSDSPGSKAAAGWGLLDDLAAGDDRAPGDAKDQADRDALAQAPAKSPSTPVPPPQDWKEPAATRDRVAAPADKPDSQRLWRSQKDPLVGRELRGLRIERKIGEGGMGSVYEALQLSLERKVALKVLSPRLRGNAQFIAKLEAEAKILARVNHPNILHVYDFGEDPTIAIYYMVMEFIDGSDLTELLQRRRRLGQVEALEIIRQAALGLDAAAQNGIIHRDVKPDNIMITKDGVCKVSDFGLATDIGVSTGEADKGKMRVGTPAFMSPEQCQGALLDVRSDVYSLGCTAFVALTGQLPFEAESPFEIMLQHRTVPPPSLRAEHASIDPDVEVLIHRMMAKRPADRFPSMGQLAQELKGLIDRLLASGSGASQAPITQEMFPGLPDWLSEES
ncbi:MAG: serine/threonine protein kinase [Planctomycetota bacterium]|nr:MAG: serine/threonine protein kinase [Planctomycetota bacterium]